MNRIEFSGTHLTVHNDDGTPSPAEVAWQDVAWQDIDSAELDDTNSVVIHLNGQDRTRVVVQVHDAAATVAAIRENVARYAVQPETITRDQLDAAQRRAWLASPGYLLVGVVIALVLAGYVGVPRWGAIGLGALGWLIALQLRGPVALVANRVTTDRNKITLAVAASSGPAEELVRVAMILLFVSGLADAVWFGFGWATLEVLFVLVSTLVTPMLLARDDDKARQAREVLAAQGGLSATSPVYGIVERVSATGIHLGCTLLVAAQPWLAVITAIAHTATNLISMRLMRRSVLTTEVFIAAVGIVLLAAGLVLAPGI
jgi:hypothetical protein